MEERKDINEWRAEKLGYVYFSRLKDLIINEQDSKDQLFDFLIDIGENHQPTGRFFAVEVKSYNDKKKPKDLVKEQFKQLIFPALLVLFDNNNDHGYYAWIKKPQKNGDLAFDAGKADVADLNNESLQAIVTEIKDWYSKKLIA